MVIADTPHLTIKAPWLFSLSVLHEVSVATLKTVPAIPASPVYGASSRMADACSWRAVLKHVIMVIPVQCPPGDLAMAA
jgi:hypothetical protein